MIRKYALYALMLALAGCAQLGLVGPQSFDQRLAYAYGTYTAVQQAATTALNNREISSQDASQVLKLADESRALLDSARALSAAGNTETANSKLLLATQVLTQLQTYLRNRQ